jgi:hypothetical protein
MARARSSRHVAEMRREYDFRGGVRGKYAARAKEASNVVVLDPDVAAAFRDSKAVNRALRALIGRTPPSRTRRMAARP